VRHRFGLLVLAAAAAARPSPAAAPQPMPTPPAALFEIRVESSPSLPGARPWGLDTPNGHDIVWLHWTAIVDATAVATADAERGPDGSPQIRLGLTDEGAGKLTEAVSKNNGKRFGVIAGGKLRAAPYARGGPIGNVFVIAGALTEAEAKEIARSLGPPARPAPGAAAAAPRNPPRPISELQGRWRVVEASMNGRPVPDPKITGSSWWFRGSELTLTNGEGQNVTFSVSSEQPGVLRIDPAGSSSEKGGWLLWSRDKADLLLAFQDNLDGRPDGMQPGPKKILARLRQ
jgi:uncharacterized protein (TIGR03067 family)